MEKVFLLKTGILSPLGDDSASNVAAVSAGISSVTESINLNRNQQPIKLSSIPEESLFVLPEEAIKMNMCALETRLVQIAIPALSQIFEEYKSDEPVPLFLGMPERLLGYASEVSERLIARISLLSGFPIDLHNSRIVDNGRSAGLYALELAFRYFESTGKHFAIIGGVDSYNDFRRLSHLDTEGRLLINGELNGFAPGEAACFLFISRTSSPTAICSLSRPGLASEPGHMYSNEPYLGKGLSAAATSALKRAPNASIGSLYSTMNGEHYFAKEYGITLTRNNRYFKDSFYQRHPADGLGDIGAAAAPTAVLLCSQDKGKNENALVLASSDGAARSAVYLEK